MIRNHGVIIVTVSHHLWQDKFLLWRHQSILHSTTTTLFIATMQATMNEAAPLSPLPGLKSFVGHFSITIL
jgi:hypothetical protein